MLQLINSNAQINLNDATGQSLPAGFTQARSGADESPAFDLQMTVQAFTAAEVQAPLNEGAAPVAFTLSEADAEQWLASVLSQQAVRIEARESPEPTPYEQRAPEQDEPTAALPIEPLVQPQVQPREHPPVEPARVVSAVSHSAPLPTAQVLSASVAQMTGEVAVQMASSAAASEMIDVIALERLSSTAVDGDKSVPLTATSSQAMPAPVTAERHLKLHAPQAQWGEQMLASLREHVDLQISQRIQNATIRLDPPELGSLEIFLSHESGRLSVQLSAANADVVRLLQQTSERLRQELVGQNFVQVNVQVSADAQGGRQQGQPRQAWQGEEPVQAARISAAGSERGNLDSTSDVLVTV
ncbi:flagellar hook-length control protein FliK [Pseudomonas sp. B11D7D]|nr:flagellar hook-length control protein FliK [Pseudomonas sp. B11D7D]QNH06556.1 flagellar hook-length control protein FliK [Pseudomonas sp. B11D7D]